MESQLLEEKVIRKRLSEALISLGMNNNQIARKTDLDFLPSFKSVF